jgi:hypothetical protein
MRRYNVRRFIGHATPSFKDPSEKLTWDSRLIGESQVNFSDGSLKLGVA